MTGVLKTIRLSKPLIAIRVIDETAAVRAAQTGRESQEQARQAAAEAARHEAERRAQEQLRIQNERLLQESGQLKDLLRGIEDQLLDVEARRAQSLHELQQLAVEIAIAVSGHVLQSAIEQELYPIASLVQMAVERLESDRSIIIRIHPADLQQLQAALARSDAEWKLPANVKLVADTSLSRGSCLADGGDFGLLSTWDMQLADVHTSLKEGLQDAQTERRTSVAENQDMRRFPDRRETA